MSTVARSIRRWIYRRKSSREAAVACRENVGPHSYLDPTVHVLGWRNVRVGHHTVVSEHTWLNVNAREGDEPAIVIGNNCFIGRRNFLSSGARIRIGDYCLTGVDCHFLGSDHLHATPFAPYSATGTTLDGVIDIGPNCWLGASVTLLKNVRVGFGSILGAGSIVTRDIPPFSIVVGNPARVVKRFDVSRSEWIPIDAWTAEAEAKLPDEAAYLAQLVTTHPAVKQPRMASGYACGDL